MILRPIRLSAWRTLCLVASALGLGDASAQPARAVDVARDVVLHIDGCAEVDAGAVRRLFALELSTSLPERLTSSGAAASARVEVGCAGEQGELFELRIHDAITGKSLIRRIAPGPRTGRERLLALAVMELLVASWIELEATPEPVAKPADGVADARARTSARRVARRRLPATSAPAESSWTTTATMVAGTAWTGALHAGLGVRMARDSRRGWGWTTDLLAQTGSDEVPLGAVDTTWLAGAATVHVSREWRSVRVRAGVGARLAAVAMTGRPAQPNAARGAQLTGLAGGPLVRLAAQVQVTRGLTVSVSTESGLHALAVKALADGTDAAALDGLWLGGHVGVGWTW